jgi:hypothetical protein
MNSEQLTSKISKAAVKKKPAKVTQKKTEVKPAVKKKAIKKVEVIKNNKIPPKK